MKLILTTLALLFVLTAPYQAAAQEDVQSLDQILNSESVEEDGGVLTTKELANRYYAQCVAKDSLVLTPTEKQTLCACTSAKMSQVLSAEEFLALDRKDIKGVDARGKAIAFAFTECMEYITEPRVREDCEYSPSLAKIYSGKSRICDCTVEKYSGYLRRNASWIIMEAIKYDPMTLNPLEHYFTSMNYEDQHALYLKKCKEVFLYNRDN